MVEGSGEDVEVKDIVVEGRSGEEGKEWRGYSGRRKRRKEDI